MSAAGALRIALGGVLAGVAGLNRVEPGAPVRATPPYAEIGPIETRDWGVKDRAGAELRVSVAVRDLAERAERLDALGDAIAAAVAAMPRAFGGWRIASCAPLRSRVASEKAGMWVAVLEWRMRVLES